MKPENLLISANDDLKIADFGVANLFDGVSPEDGKVVLRGTGNLSTTEGTFHFMAPECGLGKWRRHYNNINFACNYISIN